MVARRRVDGHGTSKVIDDITPPGFGSQFKVCITLAVVACLWSRKDMRQLKEGRLGARRGSYGAVGLES